MGTNSSREAFEEEFRFVSATSFCVWGWKVQMTSRKVTLASWWPLVRSGHQAADPKPRNEEGKLEKNLNRFVYFWDSWPPAFLVLFVQLRCVWLDALGSNLFFFRPNMRENIAGRRKSDIITRVLWVFGRKNKQEASLKLVPGRVCRSCVNCPPTTTHLEPSIFRSRGLRHGAKNYYRLFLERFLKQISDLIGVKL